ncbi:hypothetical protein BCV70DRAFT_223936 [Testicularia cyperi]|uniref:Uncharacterized protein n=1 Tax=Testicularia cyperi TaxID=1882483 RepID=A0A317XMJ2_9BASI|nr:hypothetical protein BCV70DRAFT_223936 [Testicularia cyperi]
MIPLRIHQGLGRSSGRHTGRQGTVTAARRIPEDSEASQNKTYRGGCRQMNRRALTVGEMHSRSRCGPLARDDTTSILKLPRNSMQSKPRSIGYFPVGLDQADGFPVRFHMLTVDYSGIAQCHNAGLTVNKLGEQETVDQELLHSFVDNQHLKGILSEWTQTSELQ